MPATKVQRDLMELQWSTWVPLFGALGAMTFTNVTVGYAKFSFKGNELDFSLVADGETAGTASDTITFTLPASQAFLLPLSNAVDSSCSVSISEDGGATWVGGVGRIQNTLVEVGKSSGGNFSIGPGVVISVTGKYEIDNPTQ